MSTDNEYELVLSTPRQVAQELVKQAFRGDHTTNVELLAEARYWYALVPATNPETISNRDLARHWAAVSAEPSACVELKKWLERSKEALERSKEAIKRAKEAIELTRTIVVGPTAK